MAINWSEGMSPSSSEAALPMVQVFLLIYVLLGQADPCRAAGLTFSNEPESELIENGRVRFMCEPQQNLDGLVEVRWFRNDVELKKNSSIVIKESKCGKAHWLEVRETTRASFRCEISLQGSALRLVSRTAQSIATTISDYPTRSAADRADRHVEVSQGATGVIPCGPLPASEPSAVPVVLTDGHGRVPLPLLGTSAASSSSGSSSRGDANGPDSANSAAKFHVMPSGNVYVRNAQPEDSGCYWCEAENPLTKERRRAPFKVYLLVQRRHAGPAMRVNATIVHRPPARLEAVVGSNVTLECLGDGWPRPTIRWRRLGTYLPGQVDAEGTLTLTAVSAKHSGEYECSVTNHVTAKVRSTLVVHEPPRLREPDASASVFEVNTDAPVTLECEVLRGEPRPNITWYFNGRRLVEQLDRHVFVSDNEVHIEKARKEWHHGHYQCFATNVLGQTYVQFLVRVISSSREMALPPQSLPPSLSSSSSSTSSASSSSSASAAIEPARRRKHRLDQRMKMRLPAPPRPVVRQVADGSVEISWNAMPSSNASVQFLKVQYAAKGAGEHWQTPDDEISPTATKFCVDGLASRKYRFRLLAVFENQDHRVGKNSEWIVVTRTASPGGQQAAADNNNNNHNSNNNNHNSNNNNNNNKHGGSAARPPDEVPQLTARPESATSVRVTWTMARPPQLDGFELAYRRTDSAGEWSREKLPPTLPWTFTILGLSPSQHYELKVGAFNRQGLGNYSAIIVARTNNDVILTPDERHGADAHGVNGGGGDGNHDNDDSDNEHNSNSIGLGGHDLLRVAVSKQHAVLVAALAGTFGLACLVFLACVVYYGRRLAGDRLSKSDERVRRQREAAAYVNDANSTFTPSISTVDLESTHGHHQLEQSLEEAPDDDDDASGSESDSLSMKSVSHEEVPRSEKEYALKILTQLYATGSSGHIVNINSNFNTTRVQSV